MFIDEAEITVQSGKGGDGMLHFRKEKYINRGGPDGGEGGKGGDVVLVVNPHLNTLYKFRRQSVYRAEDGKRGGVKNQTGRSADDLMIEVPAGTMVFDQESGEQIADLVEVGQQMVVCPGGRGGRGNTRFATSRNQAPRLAEKGEPGAEKRIKLELRLIADIGIIGMPNAGKSSFLAAVTNATPKIADYPFTTLVPNLGVVELDDETTLVLADIPGLIEGAHAGVGLGDAFLRHIQRTRVLIHVLDGTSGDVFADFSQINAELALFDPALEKKAQVVAVNKIDLSSVAGRMESIKKQFKGKGIQVFAISALARQDLVPILWKAKQLLDTTDIEEDTENIPVYRPESREVTFKITKLTDRWVITGAAVERVAAMTFWENFESIRRFHRILDALGIVKALNERGIEEGDTVVISDHELVWTQEWKDD
jgi:GTP-binding protein